MLILMDNVRLFTYDMSELLRFQGKPISLFDKCQSCFWIMLFVYFWVTVGFAIDYTAGKAEELILQTTSEHAISSAQYNVSEVLGPIHLVSYFETKSLLRKMKDLHGRSIPEDWG